jgi:hypothetical protein
MSCLFVQLQNAPELAMLRVQHIINELFTLHACCVTHGKACFGQSVLSCTWTGIVSEAFLWPAVLLLAAAMAGCAVAIVCCRALIFNTSATCHDDIAHILNEAASFTMNVFGRLAAAGRPVAGPA